MKTVDIEPQAYWTPERVALLGRQVTVVLVAGILLGFFAAWANMYYVLAAAAAALIVTLLAWQFEAALAVYALVAFVPWGETPNMAVGGSGVGKGLYVSEIMLGFLLVLWLGRYLFGALPKDRIRAGFYIPLALYLAYSVLNVVNSFIFWDPHVSKVYQDPRVNMIELGLRFLSAGALAMMATTVSSEKWLKWTTVAIMIPGAYNLANALFGARIPLVAPWWPMVALLPIGYSWAVALDSARKPLVRILCAAVFAVAVYVVLIQGITWVSGWLGLFVTVGTVTYLKSRRVFALSVVALALVVVLAWPFFAEKVILESAKSDDLKRWPLVVASWRYATKFPLGIGIGNYRTYHSYHYGEEWHIPTFGSAHGSYTQHLSEMGIPGLVLFLVLIVGGSRWLVRSYRELAPGPAKMFLLAAAGQMVGISCAAIIGDYIIPTYHNGGITTFSGTVYSWLIWGLAVAHVRIAKNQPDGPVDIDRQLEYV